jgi:hypothetical protein
MDQVSGSDSGPAITFSVAGVGSDGRTTYVATESDSAVTAACELDSQQEVHSNVDVWQSRTRWAPATSSRSAR